MLFQLIDYLVANPLLAVAVMMLMYNAYNSNKPFPTVDYGYVESLSSNEEHKKAVNQKTDTAQSDSPPPHTLSVVDYYATWCPPCKAAVPVYARLSEKYRSQGVRFYKCDVDQNKGIAGSEGIKAMPTFKVFKAGECVGTLQGFQEGRLKAMIDEAL